MVFLSEMHMLKIKMYLTLFYVFIRLYNETINLETKKANLRLCYKDTLRYKIIKNIRRYYLDMTRNPRFFYDDRSVLCYVGKSTTCAYELLRFLFSKIIACKYFACHT